MSAGGATEPLAGNNPADGSYAQRADAGRLFRKTIIRVIAVQAATLLLLFVLQSRYTH